ncbi:MAG TPA: hypothetical protein VGQ93_06865 [Lysobacter sp.]|jgi:hypothetical protein|nr:hypothetical protein [Lysobacter sp.]
MSNVSLRKPLLAGLGLGVLAACTVMSQKSMAPESASTEAASPTSVMPPNPPINPPINPTVNNCNITKPNAPVNAALLTSGLPCQPQFVPPFDLDNLQHGFDFYSWLTFISLNAPIDGQAPAPGNAAPTQWENWRELSDVMQDGGVKPGGWNAPRSVPAVCRNIPGAEHMRLVRRTSLRKTLTSEVVQPFDSGPLIDQNGMYVRYEILVNKPMFEYIVQNGLYNKSGQGAFTGDIAFPEGNVTTGSTGTMGAIMVKAAWKVMGVNDDTSRFHIVKALAYNPPSENPKVKESCSAVTLGLVGWHASHKTSDAPEWIWSTFEQVDNVPTDAQVVKGKLGAHYNFYRPHCTDASCAINTPPPQPWDPNQQPFPGGFTSQITRVVPLTAETVKLNNAFLGILGGTVWNNYELVSTQWPTDPDHKSRPTDNTGVPAPTFLANTTLETYTQGEIPKSSSSCMDCHNRATDTTGRFADFTFILGRAQ